MVAPTTPHPTIYTDRLITADELAAMPEHARYELVLGRLVPVAPASTHPNMRPPRLRTLHSPPPSKAEPPGAVLWHAMALTGHT
jgi:hypothetical protein